MQAARLAQHGAAPKSALDDRSLSLMQNTQALLGPSASSRVSRDVVAPRPANAAAQQLSFGSFSPVARRRPPPQQPGIPSQVSSDYSGHYCNEESCCLACCLTGSLFGKWYVNCARSGRCQRVRIEANDVMYCCDSRYSMATQLIDKAQDASADRNSGSRRTFQATVAVRGKLLCSW